MTEMASKIAAVTTSSLRLELVNSATRMKALGRQRKPLFHFRAAFHQTRDMFAHHGPMLEPVAGASAHQPDVREVRMPVDQKIAGRSILVLAYARLHQRRTREGRKALGQKRPCDFEPAGQPIARVWIELWPGFVEGQLETPILDIRQRECT